MAADGRAEIVRKMWTAWCAGDVETALANMSDGITWTIPGNREVSGSRQGKAAMRQLFGDVHGMFPQGLKVDFHQLHTTNDSVIAEMTIHGPANNGKHYKNEYCIVFDISKDKIEHGRVYVDLTEAAAVFDS
jgi:ketosteroid isomerase-like protein